jgi:hypothetical protein
MRPRALRRVSFLDWSIISETSIGFRQRQVHVARQSHIRCFFIDYDLLPFMLQHYVVNEIR